MQVFFSAGAPRSQDRRQSAGCTQGAGTGHVHVPYSSDWKVTCSVGLLQISKFEKAAGPVRANARTAGCKNSFKLFFFSVQESVYFVILISKDRTYALSRSLYISTQI